MTLVFASNKNHILSVEVENAILEQNVATD